MVGGFILVAGLACSQADTPAGEESPSDGVPPTLTGVVSGVLREHRTLGGPDDFGMLYGFAVVNDTHLLIGDQAADSHLVVVEIESGVVTTRFGRRGDGPGEFRLPNKILPDPELADTWWIYDFANWNWTPVTMQESPSEWTLGDRYSLAGLPRVPETPMWVGNRVALVHGMFSEFAVAQVTFSDDGLRVADWTAIKDPQPFTRDDVPQDPGLSMMNRSFVAVRPGGDRFAVAYQFDNWIEVRDRNGRLIRKIDGPREVTPNYRIDDNGRFHLEDDTEDGYVAAYGIEDGFYLLWCGAPGAARLCPIMGIHHYDWDGNFLREFGIDEQVLDFAVSSTGDRLWAFMPGRIPPVIGEWIIPAN